MEVLFKGFKGLSKTLAALGSMFISFTALDKNLGVRPPVTLIEEFPWVIAPGANLGKLFLVYIIP